MATPEHIIAIIQKRFQQLPLTEQDLLQLKQWYFSGEADNKLFGEKDWEQDMVAYLHFGSDRQKQDHALRRFMSAAGFLDQTIPVDDIAPEIKDPPYLSSPLYRIGFQRQWGWVAAIVLVLVTAAIALFVSFDGQPSPQTLAKASQPLQTDILPGSNKAVLTVNNRSWNLSDNKTGIAVGSSITYTDGERIADAGQILELKTPVGGQYRAVLPDGSKVWLNAASSIKFPSQFTDSGRNVEITGEVYLEVASNSRKPFNVMVRGARIMVLGTSFNVNSYSNEEAVRTTLVEGAVRVLNGTKTSLLQPGEQAVVNAGHINNGISIQSADIDQVLAWKNGIFNFENSDIRSVMKQLERWYGIKVTYEGELPSFEFSGKMDRGVTFSTILRFLTDYGVKTRLEGKTLTILGE